MTKFDLINLLSQYNDNDPVLVYDENNGEERRIVNIRKQGCEILLVAEAVNTIWDE